jgi:hypothetical protein
MERESLKRNGHDNAILQNNTDNPVGTQYIVSAGYLPNGHDVSCPYIRRAILQHVRRGENGRGLTLAVLLRLAGVDLPFIDVPDAGALEEGLGEDVQFRGGGESLGHAVNAVEQVGAALGV